MAVYAAVDHANGASVTFTTDATDTNVVRVDVITTARPIRCVLLNANGTERLSITVPPDQVLGRALTAPERVPIIVRTDTVTRFYFRHRIEW